MKSFLILQTAFIGDVILATPVIESLRQQFDDAQIDFMLRKGNESLVEGNPHINHLYIWDKKKGKYKDLKRILKEVRRMRYDYIINLQRFGSTGLFTAFSKGKTKIGFRKNPFSFSFHVKADHDIGNGKHEVDRNLELIKTICSKPLRRPTLYPSDEDEKAIDSYADVAYVCMAPASVWFTKQLPKEKWIELTRSLAGNFRIIFLGAPGDASLADEIIQTSKAQEYLNLCGKLSFLQSAKLMEGAAMNYVNDSGPLHLASSVNAPVTSFFCSTIPDFGFGPLSDESRIAQIEYDLNCRPCGLHGKKTCPEGHFLCGYDIEIDKYIL